MHIDYFVKPGWKNFLLSLLIWYAGVVLYSRIGLSSYTVWDSIIFYTKYSWPNFLLCYVIIIWLIPKFLLTKKYGLLVLINISLLAVYIIVRYYNHILQFPNMYSFYKTSQAGSVLQGMSFMKIVSGEAMWGLQFTFIAYAYRFIFDWVIIERRTRKLENEKLKADLAMLRYQLNPHFLFNTINDIYYLAIIKSDKTPDALLKLSELLRYVLHEKEDWVPLEKEIAHLKQFVELHHFRFPDEVVNLNIQNGTAASVHKVPPLLLTTFVENAFKHGQPGTKENPVLIDINLHDHTLYYKVENQVGTENYKDETTGIGKPNLEKRLNLLYPGKHKISFSEYNKTHIAQLELQLN